MSHFSLGQQDHLVFTASSCSLPRFAERTHPRWKRQSSTCVCCRWRWWELTGWGGWQGETTLLFPEKKGFGTPDAARNSLKNKTPNKKRWRGRLWLKLVNCQSPSSGGENCPCFLLGEVHKQLNSCYCCFGVFFSFCTGVCASHPVDSRTLCPHRAPGVRRCRAQWLDWQHELEFPIFYSRLWLTVRARFKHKQPALKKKLPAVVVDSPGLSRRGGSARFAGHHSPGQQAGSSAKLCESEGKTAAPRVTHSTLTGERAGQRDSCLLLSKAMR